MAKNMNIKDFYRHFKIDAFFLEFFPFLEDPLNIKDKVLIDRLAYVKERVQSMTQGQNTLKHMSNEDRQELNSFLKNKKWKNINELEAKIKSSIGSLAHVHNILYAELRRRNQTRTPEDHLKNDPLRKEIPLINNITPNMLVDLSANLCNKIEENERRQEQFRNNKPNTVKNYLFEISVFSDTIDTVLSEPKLRNEISDEEVTKLKNYKKKLKRWKQTLNNIEIAIPKTSNKLDQWGKVNEEFKRKLNKHYKRLGGDPIYKNNVIHKIKNAEKKTHELASLHIPSYGEESSDDLMKMKDKFREALEYNNKLTDNMKNLKRETYLDEVVQKLYPDKNWNAMIKEIESWSSWYQLQIFNLRKCIKYNDIMWNNNDLMENQRKSDSQLVSIRETLDVYDKYFRIQRYRKKISGMSAFEATFYKIKRSLGFDFLSEEERKRKERGETLFYTHIGRNLKIPVKDVFSHEDHIPIFIDILLKDNKIGSDEKLKYVLEDISAIYYQNRVKRSEKEMKEALRDHRKDKIRYFKTLRTKFSSYWRPYPTEKELNGGFEGNEYYQDWKSNKLYDGDKQALKTFLKECWDEIEGLSDFNKNHMLIYLEGKEKVSIAADTHILFNKIEEIDGRLSTISTLLDNPFVKDRLLKVSGGMRNMESLFKEWLFSLSSSHNTLRYLEEQTKKLKSPVKIIDIKLYDRIENRLFEVLGKVNKLTEEWQVGRSGSDLRVNDLPPADNTLQVERKLLKIFLEHNAMKNLKSKRHIDRGITEFNEQYLSPDKFENRLKYSEMIEKEIEKEIEDLNKRNAYIKKSYAPNFAERMIGDNIKLISELKELARRKADIKTPVHRPLPVRDILDVYNKHFRVLRYQEKIAGMGWLAATAYKMKSRLGVDFLSKKEKERKELGETFFSAHIGNKLKGPARDLFSDKSMLFLIEQSSQEDKVRNNEKLRSVLGDISSMHLRNRAEVSEKEMKKALMAYRKHEMRYLKALRTQFLAYWQPYPTAKELNDRFKDNRYYLDWKTYRLYNGDKQALKAFYKECWGEIERLSDFNKNHMPVYLRGKKNEDIVAETSLIFDKIRRNQWHITTISMLLGNPFVKDRLLKVPGAMSNIESLFKEWMFSLDNFQNTLSYMKAQTKKLNPAVGARRGGARLHGRQELFKLWGRVNKLAKEWKVRPSRSGSHVNVLPAGNQQQNQGRVNSIKNTEMIRNRKWRDFIKNHMTKGYIGEMYLDKINAIETLFYEKIKDLDKRIAHAYQALSDESYPGDLALSMMEENTSLKEELISKLKELKFEKEKRLKGSKKLKDKDITSFLKELKSNIGSIKKKYMDLERLEKLSKNMNDETFKKTLNEVSLYICYMEEYYLSFIKCMSHENRQIWDSAVSEAWNCENSEKIIELTLYYLSKAFTTLNKVGKERSIEDPVSGKLLVNPIWGALANSGTGSNRPGQKLYEKQKSGKKVQNNNNRPSSLKRPKGVRM